jgi:hypothetical protein
MLCEACDWLGEFWLVTADLLGANGIVSAGLDVDCLKALAEPVAPFQASTVTKRWGVSHEG